MPLDAQCTTCDKTYHVSSKLAGKRVRCPGCQGAISVPLAKPAAAKPAPPAPARARVPAPAPEPAPDDAAYDLAALAAAENAAEATEDRVYVPPPVIKEPKVREPRQSRRSTSGSSFRLTFSVWSIIHLVAILLLAAAYFGNETTRIVALIDIVVCLVGGAYAFFIIGSIDMIGDRSTVGVVLCVLIPICFWVAVLYTLFTEPARLIRAVKTLGHILTFVVYAFLLGMIVGPAGFQHQSTNPSPPFGPSQPFGHNPFPQNPAPMFQPR